MWARMSGPGPNRPTWHPSLRQPYLHHRICNFLFLPPLSILHYLSYQSVLKRLFTHPHARSSPLPRKIYTHRNKTLYNSLHRFVYKFHNNNISINFCSPSPFISFATLEPSWDPFKFLTLSLESLVFSLYISLWSHMASGSPSQASLLLQKQLKGTILYIPIFWVLLINWGVFNCFIWFFNSKIRAFSLQISIETQLMDFQQV